MYFLEMSAIDSNVGGERVSSTKGDGDGLAQLSKFIYYR